MFVQDVPAWSNVFGEGLGAYPRVEHLKGASLGSTPASKTVDKAGKACQGQSNVCREIGQLFLNVNKT